jgi:hypothetical protein
VESNEEDLDMVEESDTGRNDATKTLEDVNETMLSNAQFSGLHAKVGTSQNNSGANSVNDESKPNEWETRRLGSMAARMLQNAL